jgi:hypothetical protein
MAASKKIKTTKKVKVSDLSVTKGGAVKGGRIYVK